MKKTVLNISKFMYFLTASFMMMSMHVFAYIDPSAVTYIIQAVAAAFIAVGAIVTVFRHKIVAFFSKGKKTEDKKEIHITEDLDEE